MRALNLFNFGIRTLFSLCILLAANTALAKTVYIHDVLRVDLRAGPTNGYKIINFLSSGSAMKVLETSSDGKWTKVQYRSQAGWIQSQYLTDTPIAKNLLENARVKLAQVEQENQRLKSTLNQTNSQLKEVQTIQTNLDSTKNTLQEELDHLKRVSRNAVNTERSYRKLQESTELLKVELENLKAENAILSEDNLKEGIKWGIIAVIMGAIMAVMIPKMSGRKRRSEW